MIELALKRPFFAGMKSQKPEAGATVSSDETLQILFAPFWALMLALIVACKCVEAMFPQRPHARSGKQHPNVPLITP